MRSDANELEVIILTTNPVTNEVTIESNDTDGFNPVGTGPYFLDDVLLVPPLEPESIVQANRTQHQATLRVSNPRDLDKLKKGKAVLRFKAL